MEALLSVIRVGPGRGRILCFLPPILVESGLMKGSGFGRSEPIASWGEFVGFS